MNTKFIKMYERNAAVQRLIENNTSLTQGKPEILAVLSHFSANNQRVAEIVTQLAQPRTVLSNPRRSLAFQLRETALGMADIGILIGVRQADADKENMYRANRTHLARANQFNLHQSALVILTALQAEGVILANLGITPAHMTDYEAMVSNFGLLLGSTRDLFQQRKSNRELLLNCMRENSQILKYQLLPFAKLQKRNFPDFYREFMLAKHLPKAGQSQKAEEEALYELIGTVSDSETGKAVSGAIVSILTLDMHTNSDADGTFLFEDLPAGTYTLQCSATGYKVEQHKAVQVEDAMDSEYLFVLTPLAAEAEEAA